MKKEPKYVAALKVKCEAMPLLDLLDEVISLSAGDDMDGCFTTRGLNEFETAREILTRRVSNSLECEIIPAGTEILPVKSS